MSFSIFLRWIVDFFMKFETESYNKAFCHEFYSKNESKFSLSKKLCIFHRLQCVFKYRLSPQNLIKLYKSFGENSIFPPGRQLRRLTWKPQTKTNQNSEYILHCSLFARSPLTNICASCRSLVWYMYKNSEKNGLGRLPLSLFLWKLIVRTNST